MPRECNSGIFAGQKIDLAPTSKWNQYRVQEHHNSLGPLEFNGTYPHSSPPFMAFPTDPSPILDTHIEFKETSEAYVYKANLPGYKRNDVRVEVDDDRALRIVCGKGVEKKEQRGGWHHAELASGHFVQRLSFPDNSMLDHVKAQMDNGVLTITVPKLHSAPNTRVRNINISFRP